MVAAGCNVAFKIATKPLHIETSLVLAAYRELVIALSNGTIVDPYDARFSHNTRAADDDRQTYNDIVSKTRPNGRRKSYYTTQNFRGTQTSDKPSEVNALQSHFHFMEPQTVQSSQVPSPKEPTLFF